MERFRGKVGLIGTTYVERCFEFGPIPTYLFLRERERDADFDLCVCAMFAFISFLTHPFGTRTLR